MSVLSNRLRDLRRKSELTVRVLAEKLDKSPGYISRIESRSEIPSPELLCELADLYEVNAEELFELAKQSYLERLAGEIDSKYESALSLYRKNH
jgi:transcriptional regulator with XRE-family HTH domain